MFVPHLVLRTDTAGTPVITGTVESTVGNREPIIRVYVADTLVITLDVDTADALADALIDATAAAADPPIVTE